MAYDRSRYIDLAIRAQSYTSTSYPYTSESLGRASVMKELIATLWELVDENEKQAAEISELKELLEQKQQMPRRVGAKKPRKSHER